MTVYTLPTYPVVEEKLETGGGWTTEAEACAALDQALAPHSRAVAVFSEVDGHYIYTRPGVALKAPRIDRLIIPRQPLIDAGWPHGAFGIEVKHSVKKAGPAICQAIDYANAVFRLPTGILVAIEWCFIFPLREMHGDIASIMMQHRVGRAWLDVHGNKRLSFGAEGPWGIHLYLDGRIEARALSSGRRIGSR